VKLYELKENKSNNKSKNDLLNKNPSLKKIGEDLSCGARITEPGGFPFNPNDGNGKRIDKETVESISETTQPPTLSPFLSAGGGSALRRTDDGKQAFSSLLDEYRIRSEKILYNHKFVCFNDRVEHIEYKEARNCMKARTGGKRGSKDKEKMSNEQIAIHEMTQRLNSATRARKEVRYCVNANIDVLGKDSAKFLTLTFKEDIRDQRIANRLFSKFIQRVNYHLGKRTKYLAVVEFQDKKRKGVIHYHVIFFNVPYLPAKK